MNSFPEGVSFKKGFYKGVKKIKSLSESETKGGRDLHFIFKKKCTCYKYTMFFSSSTMLGFRPVLASRFFSSCVQNHQCLHLVSPPDAKS